MVSLARQRSASLHVNQTWAETVQNLDNDKSTDRGTSQYMRSKLASAQWFIKAIRERESNMLKVIRAIVQFQTEYFKFGDTMQLQTDGIEKHCGNRGTRYLNRIPDYL